MEVATIAMIFEFSIATFILFLSGLVLLKYFQKENQNILNLFFLFLFSSLGVYCSFTARVLKFGYGYSATDNFVAALFIRDLLALFFIALAVFALFQFSRGIFNEESSKGKTWAVNLLTGVIMVFTWVASLQADSPIYIFAYFLVFGDCFLVCIPIAVTSNKARKKMEDPVYRWGFTCLEIMGVLFSLIFVSFGVGQFFVMGMNWEFHPFYWAGWIMASLVAVFGYMGFLLPKWVKKRLGKHD